MEREGRGLGGARSGVGPLPATACLASTPCLGLCVAGGQVAQHLWISVCPHKATTPLQQGQHSSHPVVPASCVATAARLLLASLADQTATDTALCHTPLLKVTGFRTCLL